MKSALRRSLPVILPSFINRCGTIGINLVPMILIDHHVSSAQSSVVMSVVKFMSITGLFAGGWAADKLGLRNAFLLSFLVSGISLGVLPFAPSLVWIAVLASAAQMSHFMIVSPVRLLVKGLGSFEEQRDSFGWMRAANNGGQILCYLLGTFLGHLGITFLMLFDSITSFLATAVGARLLPKSAHSPLSQKTSTSSTSASHAHQTKWNEWVPFLLMAALAFGFSFQYEMFIIAAAAKSRATFGESGLKMFSVMMVLNTILCTVLSVPATRRLTNPRLAFPLALTLMGFGNALAFSGTFEPLRMGVGMLLMTLGELAFTALSSFVIVTITPQTKRQGQATAAGFLANTLGMIVAGAVAFPLIVHGSRPHYFLGFIGLGFALLAALASHPISKLLAAKVSDRQS